MPKIFVNGQFYSSTYHQKRGHMFFLEHSVDSHDIGLDSHRPNYWFKLVTFVHRLIAVLLKVLF